MDRLLDDVRGVFGFVSVLFGEQVRINMEKMCYENARFCKKCQIVREIVSCKNGILSC